MTTPTGHGLMAFWSSIAPEHQLAFQRWHNCEHIPERVSTPGFLRGRRYRSVVDPERFLMFYETRDEHVLASPAYLAALNSPTKRTREALGWFTKSTRNVFRLQHEAGAATDWPAPVLVVAGFDMSVDRDGEDSAARLEALRAGHLFHRARCYRATASHSSTSNESAIHGARPGAQDGLLIADSTRLDLLDDGSVQSRLAADLSPFLAGESTGRTSIETYALDYALDSTAADAR